MVRKILTIIGVLTSFTAIAQIDCQIYFRFSYDTVSYTNDTTVCYKENLILYTKYSDTLSYLWEPGGDTLSFINVAITDTTSYYLNIYTGPEDTLFCTDSIKFNTYPKMIVEFENILKDCPDSCRAQAKGTASEGFPPYRYRWLGYDGLVGSIDSSWAVQLCAGSSYTFRVWDTLCVFDTTFKSEPYEIPKVELTVVPDTIYRTKPKAEFSFENPSSDTVALSYWSWIFPDGTSTNDEIATFVFQDTASTVLFAFTTEDGCVDTISTDVTLKEFEMEIPNVFTPNGDGYNELWKIPDLDKYISNEIVVYDRWGRKVFEATNYSNNWDGGKLGDGVYFYLLRCAGYWKEDVYKGSVTIIGSKY